MDLMKYFTQKLREMALLNPGDRLVIGVSGGADSLTLMHLFAQTRDVMNIEPHVVHVHHGIRGEEADQDAAFVAQMAEAWGLPHRIERVDVPRLAQEHRLTLEEAARKARYTLLAQTAHEIGASVIAVAHNADDQAETVLMHLLRGSGLAGLRGMLPVASLSNQHLLPDAQLPAPLSLIRPLLEVPRAEIDKYCVANGLHPRIDSSNADTSYFRNRVRHEIMPMLERASPNLKAGLWRTSNIAAVNQEYIEAEAQHAINEMTIAKSDGVLKLDLQRWQVLSLTLQREVIRLLARKTSPPAQVGFDHINSIVSTLHEARIGTVALMSGFAIRIGYTDLSVTWGSHNYDVPNWPLIHTGFALEISELRRYEFGEWEFSIEPYYGSRTGQEWDVLHLDQWVALFSADNLSLPLTLRSRKRGERFYPQGAGGSQKISDFMINAKIPGLWRDWLPILTHGDEVIWVCGYRVDERYLVRPDTQRVWLARFEKITDGQMP